MIACDVPRPSATLRVGYLANHFRAADRVPLARVVVVPNDSVADDPAQPMPKRPPHRLRSPGRHWGFRIAAILCGLLPVVLLEFGLRWAGVGHDLQLVIPVEQAAGWYRLNPRFDEAYFGQANLSGPEPRPFRLPKPPDTRRILVVGGSTVIGFPYTADLAFPRLLQSVLQAQLADGATVEVLNAGITALNSSSEAAVVREGLACDPDVIVVYSGHNEFYGPGGVASGAGSLEPEWFRRLAAWRRLRIVQLGRRVIGYRHVPTEDLMERLSADRRIPLDGALFQRAVARWEQNLRTIKEAAQARGIPLVLVGPVCNERDQPPLEAAIPSASTPDEPEWQSLVRQAERLLRYDQPAAALPALQSAEAAAASSAIVQYRLAQALDRLGNPEEAARHYALAVDQDETRFRAPTAFRTAMAKLAKEPSSSVVAYCDLRKALAVSDQSGIPGRTHFFEHVHFTWEGNVVVAQAIGAFLLEEIWHTVWSEERRMTDQALREQLAVQPEEHLAAATLAMMVYEKPPFRDAADARRLAKVWADETVAQVRRLPALRRDAFIEMSAAEMAVDPLSALERRFRSAGLVAEDGDVLLARTLRRPWDCAARHELDAWRQLHESGTAKAPTAANTASWPCLSN